jgi:DNA-binding NtrC family response regulator
LSAELSRNKPLEAGSAPGRSPWNGLSRRDRQAPNVVVALSSESVLMVDDLASVPDRALATRHRKYSAGNRRLTAACLLGIGRTTLYRKLKKYATAAQPTDLSPGRNLIVDKET